MTLEKVKHAVISYIVAISLKINFNLNIAINSINLLVSIPGSAREIKRILQISRGLIL